MEKIHSFSRENVGTVIVQFKLSTNLDRAMQEVRDKVSAVASKLPREADVPVVGRVDLSARARAHLRGERRRRTRSTLRKLIDDKLKPALAQLEGVADVRITGGDVREIQVDIDLDKARAVGVAPTEVAQRIGAENLDLPAGRLQLGPTELTVRSLGQFKNVEELRATARGPRAARAPRCGWRRSPRVTDGVAERRTTARLNGADAIILDVVKQPGSNTVAVSDAVKKAMAEARARRWATASRPTLIIDQSHPHPRERPRGVDRPDLRRRDGGARHPVLPARSARHAHQRRSRCPPASSAPSS